MDPPPSPSAAPRTRLRSFLGLVSPPVLSGILLACAYPPFRLWPIAWLALAPWYAQAGAREPGSPEKGLRRGAVSGFWLGLTLFLVGMTWMNEIGTVPWIILSLIEALPFALLGVATFWLLPRLPVRWHPIVFAALWALGEGLRTQTRYAFPWFILAATQAPPAALPFLQVLSVTGQWGLSFALALSGALWGEVYLLLQRSRSEGDTLSGKGLTRKAAVALLLPVSLWIFGALTLRAAGPPAVGNVPVGIAQGNVIKAELDYEDARTSALQTYVDLTRDAAAGNPKPLFVVWPETVVPGVLLRDAGLRTSLEVLAQETDTSLLVGAVDLDNSEQMYNSAFLLDRRGAIIGRYDKTQLVPVGEFFPLREVLGRFYEAYNAPRRDMAWGTLPGVLDVEGREATETEPAVPTVRAGNLICYESAFGRIARERVRKGAEILVLLTSDQTFGTTAGPYQHADLALLRAVETRRPLVRAASTGVSEFIDPYGRIQKSLAIGERGVLLGTVSPRADHTFFVRAGDWFLWLCGAIAVIAAGFIATRKPKQVV